MTTTLLLILLNYKGFFKENKIPPLRINTERFKVMRLP